MKHRTRRTALLALASSSLVILVLLPGDMPRRTVGTRAGRTAGTGTAPLQLAATAGAEARAVAVLTAERRGRYWAPPGSAFRFEFETLSRSRAQVGERETASVGCRGELFLTVVDRSGEEILAEVAFGALAPTRSAAGDRPDPAPASRFLALAQEPIGIRMTDDGAIRAYRFPDGLAADQRNFVRDIVGNFGFAVPVEPTASWSCVQADATGLFEAEYEVRGEDDAGLSIARAKTLYWTAAGFGDQVPAHELSGESTASLCGRTGWLREAHVEEVLLMELPLAATAVGVAYTADLRLRESALLPAAVASPDAWRGPWSPASGHDEDLAAVADAQVEDCWRRRLEGVELQCLVADLVDALAAGPAADPDDVERLLELLEWKVRLDPAAAEGLRERIVARAADPGFASVMLQTLALAGNRSAEQALAGIYGDATLGSDLRDGAAIAMFQLARPSAELVAAVASSVAELDGAAAWGPDDERRMLLLGALVSRMDGAPAVETLVGFEDLARTSGRVDVWLEALGNAGAEPILPHVLKYAFEESAATRAAAASALREVDSPLARQTLMDLAVGDGSSEVRERALFALGHHTSPAARDELAQLLQGASATETRIVALHALSSLAGVDESTRLLVEQIALQDADPEVRAMAQGILEQGSPF